MSLRSLTGKPTWYPKISEMSVGEVLFEKAKLVDHGPSQNYPNAINFFFELPEAVETERGTTDRMGVSAGQITKAMKKLDENFDNLIGKDFRLVFEGENVMSKGPFAGKTAKAFTLQVYEDENTNVARSGDADIADVNVDKVAAAQARATESKSGTDALDEMMN